MENPSIVCLIRMLRTLFTFTSTKTLRILHFDGFSAVKMPNSGALQVQNILAWGNVSDLESDGMYGEWERVRLLCPWAKQFGIGGFTRLEANFEVGKGT